MYSVFRNLAIIMLTAKFFGLVARKCKAPQVVGEIIARTAYTSVWKRQPRVRMTNSLYL